MERRTSYKTKLRHRQRLEHARSYVLTSLDGEVSLSDIAELSCYSPVHFQAVFSENMGETFSEYLLRNRLFLAERRLLETHEKLNDLAFLSGFSSQANFTRAFKQWFDFSPAKYRKQYFGDKRPPLIKSKSERRTQIEPTINVLQPSTLLAYSAKGYMSSYYDHTLWDAMNRLCELVAGLNADVPLSAKPFYLAEDVIDLTRLEAGTKMAAVQIDKSLISNELSKYVYNFSGGLYATFSHQGVLPEQTVNLGLFDWLPASAYQFDWSRPVLMASDDMSFGKLTRATDTSVVGPRQCLLSDGLGMKVAEIEGLQIDVSLPIQNRLVF